VFKLRQGLRYGLTGKGAGNGGTWRAYLSRSAGSPIACSIDMARTANCRRVSPDGRLDMNQLVAWGAHGDLLTRDVVVAEALVLSHVARRARLYRG